MCRHRGHPYGVRHRHHPGGRGDRGDVHRRARVQARQIFTYAVAGELGWTGPWREAVAHGHSVMIETGAGLGAGLDFRHR